MLKLVTSTKLDVSCCIQQVCCAKKVPITLIDLTLPKCFSLLLTLLADNLLPLKDMALVAVKKAIVCEWLALRVCEYICMCEIHNLKDISPK